MLGYTSAVLKGIWTVVVGMKATFVHLFQPANTLQYPREKAQLPDLSRMRLFMRYEDCIGCLQCAKACPVDCITIDTVKSDPDEDLGITSDGRPKKQWVLQFDIDMAKCCYCALCVYPCPTDCIFMTTEYEFSEYSRENLVYHFSPFTPESRDNKKRDLAQKREARRAAKEAAKPAPKATEGDAPAADSGQN